MKEFSPVRSQVPTGHRETLTQPPCLSSERCHRPRHAAALLSCLSPQPWRFITSNPGPGCTGFCEYRLILPVTEGQWDKQVFQIGLRDAHLSSWCLVCSCFSPIFPSQLLTPKTYVPGMGTATVWRLVNTLSQQCESESLIGVPFFLIKVRAQWQRARRGRFSFQDTLQSPAVFHDSTPKPHPFSLGHSKSPVLL